MKARLDGALSSLVWLKMSLLTAGGLDSMASKGPFPPDPFHRSVCPPRVSQSCLSLWVFFFGFLVVFFWKHCKHEVILINPGCVPDLSWRSRTRGLGRSQSGATLCEGKPHSTRGKEKWKGRLRRRFFRGFLSVTKCPLRRRRGRSWVLQPCARRFPHLWVLRGKGCHTASVSWGGEPDISRCLSPSLQTRTEEHYGAFPDTFRYQPHASQVPAPLCPGRGCERRPPRAALSPRSCLETQDFCPLTAEGGSRGEVGVPSASRKPMGAAGGG